MSKKSDYLPTKTYATLTSGQALRIMRELQGMSQVELSRASGVTQTAISALERDRETLGIDRAKSLAGALRIHPAVLVFPDLAPAAKPPPRPRKSAIRTLTDDELNAAHERVSGEPESASRRVKGAHPRRPVQDRKTA